MLCFQFLNGTMDVAANTIRGLGYSFSPMVVTLVGVCVFRLAWVAWVFPVLHSPESLYVSYPISWTITTVILFTIFFVIRKKAYARVQSFSLASEDVTQL